MKDINDVMSEALQNYYEYNKKVSPVVIYGGRFQPFHSGHYSIYQHCVNEYGVDNVFIVSSNKTNLDNSPFNFLEKKHIMTEIFDIPSDKIIQVQSPYRPTEITNNLQSNVPIIIPVSQKDSERLSTGQYFRQLSTNSPLMGHRDAGYFLILPEFKFDIYGKNISGSSIRELMRSPEISFASKENLFKALYGDVYDEKIFNLFKQRLNISNTSMLEDSVFNQEDIITKRITNPNTGNKILLTTALKFNDDHPAYNAAKNYIKTNGHISEWLQENDDAMMHPYDNLDMTFEELRFIIKESLVGNLSDNTTEKIDGQKLLFTFKDGVVLFARGKTHIKNSAEHALTSTDIINKYSGRHEIGESFATAAHDIETAITSLSRDFLKDMFAGGRKFMAIEIVHTGATNVIPYAKNIIVLHSLISFDGGGDPIHINYTATDSLIRILAENHQHKQKTYEIINKNTIVFSTPTQDDFTKAQYFMAQFDVLLELYNIIPTDTIGNFLEGRWTVILADVPWVTDDVRHKLIQKWVYNKNNINHKDFDSPDTQQWFLKTTSKITTVKNYFLSPFKKLVLLAGAHAIKRAHNILINNVPGATDTITVAVKNAIENIKNFEGDSLVKLTQELEYLEYLGFDNILPTEGIVFVYNGNVYKLTGAFAPINKLLGTIRYSGLLQPPTTTPSPTTSHTPRNIDYNKPMQNPETGNDIKLKTALSYPPNHPANLAAKRLLGI